MPYFTLETEPYEVLSALRPLLMPIYEAFEQGIPASIRVINENGYQHTGSLFSHLVRAEAKKFLDGRQCPIEFDDTPRTVAMQSIPMEGLLTQFEDIKVRILKGSLVPKPNTNPRRAFYQQVDRGLWISNEPPPILGLLVLWNCTPEGQQMEMQLCCTKDRDGLDNWMVPIPHPAEWMIVQPTPMSLDNVDFDDMLAEDEIKKKPTVN